MAESRNQQQGQNLLDKLGTLPAQRNQFMSDTRDVHIRTINQIFSLIQSQSQSEGTASYATLWLAARSIDDLNCAFHLSQHGHMTQSYSLIRSVVEALDLMELFHKSPSEADEWASDNLRKVRNNFRPAEVRKRLGKSPSDQLYSILCGQGSHPRFEGRHLTSHMRVDPQSGKKTLQFTVGGLHVLKDLYATHLYIIFLGQHLLLAVCQHFGSQIPNDISGKVFLTLDNAAQYLEAHLPEMAEQLFKDEGKKKTEEMIMEMKEIFSGISTFGKQLSRHSA